MNVKKQMYANLAIFKIALGSIRGLNLTLTIVHSHQFMLEYNVIKFHEIQYINFQVTFATKCLSSTDWSANRQKNCQTVLRASQKKCNSVRTISLNFLREKYFHPISGEKIIAAISTGFPVFVCEEDQKY